MYLSRVFVEIDTCVCLNYLSKLQFVFVQIEKCVQSLTKQSSSSPSSIMVRKNIVCNDFQDHHQIFEVFPRLTLDVLSISKILLQMLAWPAVALGYFGLSYGSSSMEGDFFVNSVFFVLSSNYLSPFNQCQMGII